MDDCIDQEFDRLVGSPNIAIPIGSGVLSYSILIYSLACVLDAKTAVSLFLSSFSLGMTGNLFIKMPSGLRGYQESLLTSALGIILFKRQMIASLLLMASIQLFDDYFDYDNETFSKKNWAFILGKVECFLIAMILFFISLLIDQIIAISAGISWLIIVYITRILSPKFIDYLK